jgi:hypothetical protein
LWPGYSLRRQVAGPRRGPQKLPWRGGRSRGNSTIRATQRRMHGRSAFLQQYRPCLTHQDALGPQGRARPRSFPSTVVPAAVVTRGLQERTVVFSSTSWTSAVASATRNWKAPRRSTTGRHLHRAPPTFSSDNYVCAVFQVNTGTHECVSNYIQQKCLFRRVSSSGAPFRRTTDSTTWAGASA